MRVPLQPVARPPLLIILVLVLLIFATQLMVKQVQPVESSALAAAAPADTRLLAMEVDSMVMNEYDEVCWGWFSKTCPPYFLR